MKIGIIGSGHIGGSCARQAVRGGHEVMLSFSRDADRLEAFVRELGATASAGTPAQAVAFGEVVIVSVPWSAIPEALAQAGTLAGKIVIDTTNQFGPGEKPVAEQTAASFNAARMQGARYVKSFNALTSGFQERAAGRHGDERVVQWICGDDDEAKQVVGSLIEDMGYVPVDVGGNAGCAVMEAPRRPGAVYGEEYRLAEAQAVLAALHENRPIPPAPTYG
jgi:predicted dinucleotide-binding enzyme